MTTKSDDIRDELLAALKAMIEADDAHWPLDTARQVRDAARAAVARAEAEATHAS